MFANGKTSPNNVFGKQIEEGTSILDAPCQVCQDHQRAGKTSKNDKLHEPHQNPNKPVHIHVKSPPGKSPAPVVLIFRPARAKNALERLRAAGFDESKLHVRYAWMYKSRARSEDTELFTVVRPVSVPWTNGHAMKNGLSIKCTAPVCECCAARHDESKLLIFHFSSGRPGVAPTKSSSSLPLCRRHT
jgi:hypothetical protein